jgi:DNA-binding transcriptional MerR regulator
VETATSSRAAKVSLPPIPAKRYFTIGEVSELCGVKPHVLRYYQHHEVLLIRRIRELLYEQGFTISGARNRLDEAMRERGNHKPESGPIDYARIRRELSGVLDDLTV